MTMATMVASDGDGEQDAYLVGGEEADDQQHQPAAQRLAEPIEADVDDRLEAPLGARGDRRVQQFVAGAEERIGHRFVHAAQERQAPERRRGEGDDAEQRRARRAESRR